MLLRMLFLLECLNLNSHKFLSKIFGFLFFRLTSLIHLKFIFVHDYKQSWWITFWWVASYASSIHFPTELKWYLLFNYILIQFLDCKRFFKLTYEKTFIDSLPNFFNHLLCVMHTVCLGKNCEDSRHTCSALGVYNTLDLKNIF